MGYYPNARQKSKTDKKTAAPSSKKIKNILFLSDNSLKPFMNSFILRLFIGCSFTQTKHIEFLRLSRLDLLNRASLIHRVAVPLPPPGKVWVPAGGAGDDIRPYSGGFGFTGRAAGDKPLPSASLVACGRSALSLRTLPFGVTRFAKRIINPFCSFPPTVVRWVNSGR